MSRWRLLDKSSKILKRLCEHLKVWRGFSVHIPWVHELIKPHKVLLFFSVMQDKTFTDRTWNILTKQEPRPLLTFFRIGGGIAPRGPFKSRGKVPRTFRARKQQSSRLLNVSHVRETKTISKFNAGLRTSAVRRYKGNCGTRNRPEKFRDFCETGPRSRLWMTSAHNKPQMEPEFCE